MSSPHHPKVTLRDKLSRYFRNRRTADLKAIILDSANESGAVRLLDLGGRFEFWQRVGIEFLIDNRIEITLLNLTDSELGSAQAKSAPIRFAVGDACRTEFADQSFDIVMSNSVIEHLFTWENMQAFAAETRRVGKAYYVQTPNFWFPIDPHYFKMPFFHWFPRPTRAWLLRTFPLTAVGRIEGVVRSFEMVDAARLLCRTQMAVLFPDAELQRERFMGIFVKSWIAKRPRKP